MGSLQMRVSKKQFNKNPLRQQLKVMPLLVINHFEIIITNSSEKRIMFNQGTLCSFSGIWTAFWISFWSLCEDCLVLSTTNQSFLTLMPNKNSATSREEPCRRFTDIFSQVSETVSSLSVTSTSISTKLIFAKIHNAKLWLYDFNCLILNVNLIQFKLDKLFAITILSPIEA